MKISDTIYKFTTFEAVPYQNPVPELTLYSANYKFKTKCEKSNGYKFSKRKVKFEVLPSGQKSIKIY